MGQWSGPSEWGRSQPCNQRAEERARAKTLGQEQEAAGAWQSRKDGTWGSTRPVFKNRKWPNLENGDISYQKIDSQLLKLTLLVPSGPLAGAEKR